MTSFHRWLGAAIIALFVIIMLWGLVLRMRRRDEAPAGLWALQHWTENLLAVQIVFGIVLLIMGRRVIGGPLVWFHYLYGSLFPLIAMIGGRLAAMRRERFTYVGLAWGAFIAFALTLRAVQTACGNDWSALQRCMLGS